MSIWFWWPLVFFAQNFAASYGTRARASGSLWRHFKAALVSNLVWIFGQMIILGPLFEYMTGKHGHMLQIATGLMYGASTISGSLASHWWAMRTEKGKDAVGFSKKYAQIPVEEYEDLKRQIASARDFAGQAYDLAIGGLPDSGIAATKIAGQMVITGLDK